MGPAQREKITAAKAEAVRKEEEEKVWDHTVTWKFSTFKLFLGTAKETKSENVISFCTV